MDNISVFLCSEWQSGNFCIPSDASIRRELRKRLFDFLHTGVSYLEKNKGARRSAEARLTAIDAFETSLMK